MRVITFTDETKHLFQFIWDGFLVGGRSEKPVAGKELRVRRGIIRKMKAISVAELDLPENKIMGELTRKLAGPAELELTQEELTTVIQYFESVPWLPSKSDLAADAFDLLDGAERR